MHKDSRNNIKTAAAILASAEGKGVECFEESRVSANFMYSTSIITELGRIADALERKAAPSYDPEPLKGMSDEANYSWAHYRKEYGLDGDDLDPSHRAFHAGFNAGQADAMQEWVAARDAEQQRIGAGALAASIRDQVLNPESTVIEGPLIGRIKVAHMLDKAMSRGVKPVKCTNRACTGCYAEWCHYWDTHTSDGRCKYGIEHCKVHGE